LLQVLAVSDAIAATGLDFLLDVHGDEEIPANFIGSMFGVPAWGPRLERMQNTFLGEHSCLLQVVTRSILHTSSGKLPKHALAVSHSP
jgi:hypothetical protein